MDGDGYSRDVDCDDNDIDIGLDCDGDGFIADDDCDDNDPLLGGNFEDCDGDGLLVGEDCYDLIFPLQMLDERDEVKPVQVLIV